MNPSDSGARAAGGPAAIETDALVVGAGPVGLFQVFELGLLEIGAVVVDVLPRPGGQCVQLYADKPIYDIPGTPATTGRELVERLLQQVAPFAPAFHLDQEVATVRRGADGRFEVGTSAGTSFRARTIVIAGGVGSFQPRRLKLAGLDAHHGRQVLYRTGDPAALAGLHVLVVGDDDAALTAAIDLADAGADRPASVTLMHRRDQFRATAATLARLQAARASGRLDFVAGQAAGLVEEGGALTALEVDTADGARRVLRVDRLLVLLGLSPQLGPIAGWGVALDRKQVVVDTATFETDVAGIFAVGDVVTYPGKKKLILSGFHEAALAAYGAARHVHPGRPMHLEYTTTSPRLQRLLKVAPTTEPDAA